MSTIDVALDERSYHVHVERGALARVGAVTIDRAPHTRALLVVDANVATHADVVDGALRDAGYDVTRATVMADEHEKTMPTVERLLDAMLAARLERGSPVVAVGGGITGDVAGFAAAIYLRGVPVVQVPTTLLAMVDASVGGKTGVNRALPGGAVGKNLVGAFWQPAAVVADPATLRTLDPRDLRCGLAECVKHGILADAAHVDWIEANADGIAALDEQALESLISTSVSIKAAVVADDEREAGRRALLNLGHTFAHAIEPMDALDLRHGEAVAIGLVAAAHVAVRTGRLAEADAGRIRDLVARVGLPVSLSTAVDAAELIDVMRFDKKVQSGRIRLVLPTSIGSAEVAPEVDEADVRAGWAAVGAG